MKIEINVTANLDIFKALKPEAETSISYAEIYLLDDKLKIVLRAETISDLRAAANSWLRLIKMCLEVEEVLKNE